MKKIGRTAYLANLIACCCQWASWRYHSDIGIAEPILGGAQFNTRGAFVTERQSESLVETVEAHIIIEQKSRVVGKNFLHTAALKLNVLVGMIVHPRFVDEEWLMRNRRGEVLIPSEPIVNRARRKFAMKTECLVEVR